MQPLRCRQLVGRRAQLQLVGGWLAGDPAEPCLTVGGEPGIGKSRLVAEALSRIGEQPVHVLEGRCEVSDRLVPFGSVLDLLRSPSRIPGGDELRERILELELDEADEADPAAELGRRRLFEAVAAALARLVAEHPLVVVGEDVHWADEASLELVGYIIRRLRDHDARILLTFRPGEATVALRELLSDIERRRDLVEVRLARLDRGDLADMVALTLRSPRVPDSLLELLRETTDGVPFLVEEVLTSLAAAAGSTRPGDLEAAAADHLEVPGSVREAVSRRVARLDTGARSVARCASVVGRRFRPGLLGRVTGLDTPELRATCDELVATQLALERPGDGYEFWHELTRRAVYEELPAGERARLHAAVAAAVAARAQPNPELAAATLAHHHYLAGEWEQAAT